MTPLTELENLSPAGLIQHAKVLSSQLTTLRNQGSDTTKILEELLEVAQRLRSFRVRAAKVKKGLYLVK